MKSILTLSALAATLLGTGDTGTIMLSEVDGADAMALAAKVLPGDIRATVVEGQVRREFLPGHAFLATYLTKAQVLGEDSCTRTQYNVHMRGVGGAGVPPSTTELLIGSVERRELQAIVFPSNKAGDASCAATKGFVSVSGSEDDRRRINAYRQIVAAMRVAKAAKPLPFNALCSPADELACRDVTRSLANLPLDELFSIQVRGLKLKSEGTGQVRIIHSKQIQPSEPYDVELSFGMSGEDGKSWRVRWRETGRPLAELRLERSMVIYH
ncbi:hypothetical protein [Sphingomonas sp. S2-65]|uniref:hypothetical protein n=1 Tax=Sphingomonas sp. S2-65 TaxID=2903960 RepID=UPI001F16757E|nr:hypothetical protein [Sphingomonas sp. S2-65]UYY58326.1 hypothetical protein LZ586_16965 [Sphingomonas sp. S2-65]